jgi:uncharacterized membrane protein
MVWCCGQTKIKKEWVTVMKKKTISSRIRKLGAAIFDLWPGICLVIVIVVTIDLYRFSNETSRGELSAGLGIGAFIALAIWFFAFYVPRKWKDVDFLA